MLDELKLMLGLRNVKDSALDEKLELIISGATARLSLLLGTQDIPESMNHIILYTSIVRYNRIGSEGLSSHTVEGESLSFVEDDFAGYKDEIQAYLDSQTSSKRGKVCFI